MASQVRVLAQNIRKHGFVYEDDVINYFQAKGYSFKSSGLSLLVFRINKNPIKYGFPSGTEVGSRPMIVDGRLKRIYTTVISEEFQDVDGRDIDVKARLKRFQKVA